MTYTQWKKAKFLDKELESQHNLITNVSQNPVDGGMHSQGFAFLIAKFMLQINEKISTSRVCFR